ncbi:MAG: enoyl-ACP reductase FabI [Beijerinckiaceae bacterium]
MHGMLEGKTALIVGVANHDSIAAGCASVFAKQGARVILTYLNAKAESHVRAVADTMGAELLLKLDVTVPGEMEAVFAEVGQKFGQLDILVHSIAFCPKDDLHGRVVDCSRDGFLAAMDVSVHSFMHMVKLAEPLMTRGGTCLAMSYLGAQRVVSTYNVMGPVKAALEAVTREMASELGQKGIRVHALSPGPVKTRAASGIDHFDDLLNEAAAKAPTGHLVTIEDVGSYAAFLASDAAANVTGTVPIIDGGAHIMG